MLHEDVEFHVEAQGRSTTIHKTFREAAADALGLAISGLSEVVLGVVIWSEDGARAFGGDDAVERYREDPEASVFERIEVRANSVGRVA